jgi:hypothetical protein
LLAVHLLNDVLKVVLGRVAAAIGRRVAAAFVVAGDIVVAACGGVVVPRSVVVAGVVVSGCLVVPVAGVIVAGSIVVRLYRFVLLLVPGASRRAEQDESVEG